MLTGIGKPQAAIDKLYAYVSEKCSRPLHIAESAFIICGGEDHLETYTGAVETYKNIAKYMQWKDRGRAYNSVRVLQRRR